MCENVLAVFALNRSLQFRISNLPLNFLFNTCVLRGKTIILSWTLRNTREKF